MSLNRKSCVEVSEPNCLTYSYIDCSDCKGDNYVVSAHKFYEDLFDNEAEVLRKLYEWNFALENQVFHFPVCKLLGEGCLSYSSEKNCGKG